MIAALMLGGLAGAGLWLVARGWVPARPSLAEALARLGAPGSISTTGSQVPEPWALTRIGGPGSRLFARAGIDPIAHRTARDLALVGKPHDLFLAEKAAAALIGLLLAPAMAVAFALSGLSVPLLLPAWGSLLCAVIGFLLPDVVVRGDARSRRRDFRHAFGAFLDLVVVGLAGGSGVETALADAASVGDGWAFEQLRQALARARLARESTWDALAQLGERIAVRELVDLGAAVSLAGTEGAKVRASVEAKSESLRAHQLAEAEAEAQAATERMSLPVVLLFAGFLTFIGYPAVTHVLQGL